MPIKNEILVSVTPQETRIAVKEESVLQELHLQRKLSSDLVGNIYKGKVVRVLPGMQAAFIDIGFDKNGFLHARDVCKREQVSKDQNSNNTAQIESLLREGEMVMVQVNKPPKGDKGASLTMKVSIPSRHLVLLPFSQGISISNKLDNKQARTRLINSVEKLMTEKRLGGGLIVRTLAESASDQELEADILYLQQQWEKIISASQSANKIASIHRGIPIMLNIIRDFAQSDTQKILIDSKDAYSQAQKFVAEFMPEVEAKMDLYTDENPLFSQYGVEQEINQALDRKVELAGGGTLYIDQTEAMTTIDVNTRSDVGARTDQVPFVRTNVEAAAEIARQIRLRNLSGIIIVDFIDMQASKDKKQVLHALESALAKDQVKIQISDMSSLGLVEITRQRSGESLNDILCEPCKICDARGSVKTAETVCHEILREVKRENSQFKARAYSVVASSEVIDELQNNLANSLTLIEKLVQCPISLQVDSSYSQQQYDIVLD